MDELIARATQGVDPASPHAFWQIFFNLLNLMPWAAMFWWSTAFVLVGAAIGRYRGRTMEGIVWAAALGPLGWIVVLARPKRRPSAQPPPLKPSRPRDRRDV